MPLFVTCCAVSESALNPQRGRYRYCMSKFRVFIEMTKILTFSHRPLTHIDLSMQIAQSSAGKREMWNNRVNCGLESRVFNIYTTFNSFAIPRVKMWSELVLISSYLFLLTFLNFVNSKRIPPVGRIKIKSRIRIKLDKNPCSRIQSPWIRGYSWLRHRVVAPAPPGYLGWQAGITTLCRSQLYPPFRNNEFGYRDFFL